MPSGYSVGTVLGLWSGLGYWGRLLNVHGVNTLAYDLTPTAKGILGGKDKGNRGGRRRVYNEYHGPFPPWGNDVHPGEAGVVAEQHPDRVLLLCYPPPHSDTPSSNNSNNNNNNRKKRKRGGGGVEGSVEVVGNGVGEGCMACGALGRYRGHKVAYVGEFMGDTASVQFESRLRRDWTLTGPPIPLPNFNNTTYCLTLWTRRQSMHTITTTTTTVITGVQNGLLNNTTSIINSNNNVDIRFNCWSFFSCVVCSKSPVSTGDIFYRDRLTRTVVGCSLECCRQPLCMSTLKDELLNRGLGLPERYMKAMDGEGEGSTSEDDSLVASLWTLVVLPYT